MESVRFSFWELCQITYRVHLSVCSGLSACLSETVQLSQIGPVSTEKRVTHAGQQRGPESPE